MLSTQSSTIFITTRFVNSENVDIWFDLYCSQLGRVVRVKIFQKKKNRQRDGEWWRGSQFHVTPWTCRSQRGGKAMRTTGLFGYYLFLKIEDTVVK